MANELDPQVKALLEQFQANAAQHPAPSLSTPEEVAATRHAMRSYQSLGTPFEPVSKTEDFDLPGPAGKIPVRLYVPQVGDSPLPTTLPVLIYYHGGGFIGGDLESHDTLLRALANRGRCIVVSVAYRLAPEDPYPAANEDAWSALTWVSNHAAEIGGDSHRLAVGGDSSGGLLAAWVAQKAAKDGPKLRLQVLLYPVLDFTMSMPSWKRLGTGAYLLSQAQAIERFDAYLPRWINREDSTVSPLFAINLSHVAPALIMTSDHDPLSDEGNAYAANLRAAKIAVDHTCWPGMIHGFASLAGVLDAGKAVIDRTGAALKKAFE